MASKKKVKLLMTSNLAGSPRHWHSHKLRHHIQILVMEVITGSSDTGLIICLPCLGVTQECEGNNVTHAASESETIEEKHVLIL